MTSESHIDRIDWSEEWTRVYAESSVTMRRSNRAAYWNKRADRFSSMDNGAKIRVREVLDRLDVNRNTTILDIGCGPGNLAVPLAKSAKSVTALDPAEAMLDKLEERAAREGVTNIETLNKAWDEAVRDESIIPHDIVLSSYSLIMKNIGEALEAMDAAARKTVCLFWFTGKQCFGYDKFWPTLFGEEYAAGPNHTLLLNVLDSMGIYPNVAIIHHQHKTFYADMDDAVQSWSDNLYISSQTEKDTIRSILAETLDMGGEKPVFKRDVESAMLWWDKR